MSSHTSHTSHLLHLLTSNTVRAKAGATSRGAHGVQRMRCVREGNPTHPTSSTPRFALGRILATPGALHALDEAERVRGHGARRSGAHGLPARSLATELLARHAAGDWGELDAEDQRANEDALMTGARILSAYVLPSGVRIWIITEADRSATTLLMPDEY
jgi:hypothetical protein